MAHAFHQLAEAGSGLGHQVIAGVPQVVEVDAVHAGRRHCRYPGRAPEVAVPEQLAAWRGEQQRIGVRAGVVVEMLLNLSDDAAGQDDAPFAGGGLRGAKKAAWPRASVRWRLMRTFAVALSMSRRRVRRARPSEGRRSGRAGSWRGSERTAGVGECIDLGDGQQRALGRLLVASAF
jgi:hypothetical protein